MEVLEKVEEKAQKTLDIHKAAYPEQYQDEAKKEDQEKAPKEDAKEEPPKGEALKSEDGSDNVWKHKYDVINGKYEKEIPRYAAETRGLKGDIETLQQRIEQLEVENDSLKKNPPAAATVTENELAEEFGEDGAKKITTMMNKMRDDIEAKIKPVQDKVSKFETDNNLTISQRYFKDLDKDVPDWRELDKDEEFNAYLDDYSIRPGLKLAISNLDALEVAKILNRYKKLTGKPLTNKDKKEELESQLSPGKSKGPSHVEQPKKIYSRQEIKDFYADCASGKYRFNQKDKERIEKDIFLAQNEGRVT